ncbi:hypothetical protein BD324DRAFT_650667 [Kockovaella imperatae]|uniref:CoA-binding domain-containing protein n=1 Tax=Kockovaella imperatae TaxID=4999 RepID=A0A1Y1UHV4_9TREE|nr:hypothetical protein BD324DRAFT_650667 [Kockovaella imperatae]ORX37054.1 hypothetical protein BD324DRAFT_650667 [Kockovaella imperatae]
MSITPAMKRFLGANKYIVIGSVLTDRSRWDNKVLRWYINHGLPVQPMKPGSNGGEAEDLPMLPNLNEDLSETSISIIINPVKGYPILEQLFKDKSRSPHGVWFQPGAGDSGEIKQFVKDNSLEDRIILGGPCILVSGESVLETLRT